MRPVSHPDRSDRVSLGEDLAPNVAGGLDDRSVVGEDAVRQPVVEYVLLYACPGIAGASRPISAPAPARAEPLVSDYRFARKSSC